MREEDACYVVDDDTCMHRLDGEKEFKGDGKFLRDRMIQISEAVKRVKKPELHGNARIRSMRSLWKSPPTIRFLSLLFIQRCLNLDQNTASISIYGAQKRNCGLLHVHEGKWKVK